MLIRCPACEHSRHINPDKIPSRAEFATCPKCGHRFRFRALTFEPDSGGPATEVPSADQAQGRENREQPQDIWEAMDSLHEKWKGRRAANSEQEDRRETDERPCDDAEPDERPLRDLGHFREDDDLSGGARQKPPVFIPWENPKELGLGLSFYRTMLMVLLHPVRFFAALRNAQPLAPALLFAIVFGLFQNAMAMIWWHLMITSEAGAQLAASLPLQILEVLDISRLPMVMLASPFTTALNVLVLGGLIHMMLRLVQPEAAGFLKTCKVVSYASAVYIFALAPILGIPLSLLCHIILLTVGVRHAFGLSWERLALVILPAFVVIFLLSVGQASI